MSEVFQPDPGPGGVRKRVCHPDGSVDLHVETGITAALLALAVARHVPPGLALAETGPCGGTTVLRFRARGGDARTEPELPVRDPGAALEAGRAPAHPVVVATVRSRRACWPGRRPASQATASQ